MATKIVAVFGLPCSGKTTIIKALMEASNELIAYVSSGDIARRLSTNKEIAHMAKGNLFPYEEPLREEILGLIMKRQTAGASHVIIDGFPRFDEQVQWMLEHGLLGEATGCLIQIHGDKLLERAIARDRDVQDDHIALCKKIESQSEKIDGMEKIIFRLGIPYFTVINYDLETAVIDFAKRIGLRK